MTSEVAAVIGMILFGVVGAASLLWPNLIMDWSLKYQSGWAGKLNPLRSFLGTPGHKLAIQATGLIALMVAIFQLLSLLFDLHTPTW